MSVIDKVGHVAESCRTNRGKRSVVYAVFSPGASASTHFHTDFDETLEVTEGELIVWIERKKHRLTPGDRVAIPRGVRHRFKNKSGAFAKAIVTLEPGHRGYEQNIAILRGLQADGKLEEIRNPTPETIPTGLVLARLSNVNLTGLTLLMSKLLRRLYSGEQVDQRQKELLAKYG